MLNHQTSTASSPSDETVHPAISQLLANGVTPEALQRFTKAHAFPLLEPGWATFLWVGDATQIEILRWIHGGVSRADFTRMPNSHIWTLRLPVQDGGRFEYKLGIRKGDHEHWILDPLNDDRAGDPFGENSVCKTFGYAQPEWSEPQGAPIGHIIPIEIRSSVFEETRHEQVYLPAGFSKVVEYPLVVIHDGSDFMTYADLSTSLDNLIAGGVIPPAIFALVQTRDRMAEYARGRRHARYIVGDLLPQLRARFRLSVKAEDNILLGASLGAVASLATVFRYPGVFGGVVLHSGSFVLDERKLKARPHPVFRRVARLVRAFKRAPNMPELRAFVSAGELEGLASENLALAKLLDENGVKVLFASAWDGHHWHNWRDQLKDGLVWVLNSRDT